MTPELTTYLIAVAAVMTCLWFCGFIFLVSYNAEQGDTSLMMFIVCFFWVILLPVVAIMRNKSSKAIRSVRQYPLDLDEVESDLLERHYREDFKTKRK